MPSSKTIVLSGLIRGVTLGYFGPPPLPLSEVAKREAAAFQRGKQEAAAVFDRQIVEMRQELLHLQQTVFQRLDDEFRQMQATVGERLPDLILALVRRILAGLELDPGAVKALVDEVLSEMSQGGEIEVVLCPKDMELLGSAKEDFMNDYAGLKFTADAGLGSGDCMVRSRFGLVDARIETKLRKLDVELRGH